MMNSTTEVTPAKKSLLPYIIHGILMLFSIIGFIGNGTAMFILSSSAKIRKSKSYVLLMNQSLLDFVNTILMIIYLFMFYLITWRDLGGARGVILCQLVWSQLFITFTIFGSSFNLSALSLERMVSVVWPVIHRVHVTHYRMMVTAVVVWFMGVSVATAFSVPVNGIAPSGRCYYWNKFSSRLSSQIFSILFSSVFSILPLISMFVSYAMIYARISSRGMNSNIKLNVIRMLATCVALFFLCHVLRASLVMGSRFTSRNLHDTTLFVVGILLLQSNVIVNPIIYSLQYMDYKKELHRQINRLRGRKEKVYEADTATSTTSKLDTVETVETVENVEIIEP